MVAAPGVLQVAVEHRGTGMGSLLPTHEVKELDRFFLMAGQFVQ
jgi:hypothetical protein